jgi:flagellar motor protein MotB
VLRTGIKPSTYAANLLFFKSAAGARLSHFSALLGLFGLGRSAFNERLGSILKQKWTFQEVRMKTKIMLFCAVILAVALIGLARPATRVADEAEAVAASTAAPGPDVVGKTASAANPEIQAVDRAQEQGQAEETKSQEKKQQERAQTQEEQKRKEQKQKAEKDKTIVWEIKENETHGQKIIIREGDKVKTIVVDKPVVIKEGKEGKVFIIAPDGKVIEAAEGDRAHLEVLEEGKILKVGKDDGVVYVVVDPDVHICEVVSADVGKAVELALKEIPEAVKVAESAAAVSEAVKAELQEIPVIVKVVDKAAAHITWVSDDLEKELREKLKDIREKLKEVEEKKIELREVDKALAELEKEFEKINPKTLGVAIKHKERPEVFTIVRKEGGQETGVEIKPDVGVEISEGPSQHPIKVIVKEKGSFSLFYEMGAGGKSREAYDKIVARVKRDLPEGFTLEPSFEEESGLVTLKVKGPFEKGAPHDLVQKLADGIREETKEKKE